MADKRTIRVGATISACVLLAVSLGTLFLLCRHSGEGNGLAHSDAAKAGMTEDAGNQHIDRSNVEHRSEPPGMTSETDAAIDAGVSRADAQIAGTLRGKDAMEVARVYWAKEDGVLAEMPRYEDVKSEMRLRAENLLKSAQPKDTDAILELARGELDLFWEKGGLISPESYDHGYLARAVIELALEQNNKDFKLLCGLKEAACTMAPLYKAGNGRYEDNWKTLWSIVNAQKELIDSGAVPASPEAMMAMSDWAFLATFVNKGDSRVATAALEWLAKNADAGGWGAMKRYWQSVAEQSKAGNQCGAINLWGYPGNGSTEDDILEAKRQRRLFSFCGPPEYRKRAVRSWEPSVKAAVYSGNPPEQIK